MIFNKKNIFVAILSFAVFGLNLNATTAEGFELATAFLRIPAAIGANTVGKQRGIAPKIVLIASDLIRLSNEILTIVNKRGKFDFHIYDYCWGAYDVYNLIVHVKSLFGDKANGVEKIESKEIKKFESVIRSLHQVILPLVEGMSAILKSYPDDPKLKIQNFQAFRNRCGAICSLSRLLDNLIVSEPKSAEFYTCIILLVVNIVVAYGIDSKIKPVEAEARRQEEAEARRLLEEGRAAVLLHLMMAELMREPRGREEEEARQQAEEVGALLGDAVPEDTDEEHFRTVGGQIAARNRSARQVVENHKTFSDENCSVCLDPFVHGERVRRFICGHVLHHCEKNGHEDCFGQFASNGSNVCPSCRGMRDVNGETDIDIP